MTVELKRGKKSILVDDSDVAFLSSFSVSINRQGYAHVKIPLANILLNLPHTQLIDHKNGNTSDYRRENLRPATRQENTFNRKVQKNSKSGYKGVFWDKEKKKWKVQIQRKPEPRRHYGYFTDKVEAAKVYDQKARELFGEFAWLNFP